MLNLSNGNIINKSIFNSSSENDKNMGKLTFYLIESGLFFLSSAVIYLYYMAKRMCNPDYHAIMCLLNIPFQI